jgi:hypothetical protein
MKSTILLTTALFLAGAPSPDSKTASELSAGFLSQAGENGLMAAEPITKAQASPAVSAQTRAQSPDKQDPKLKN